MLHIIYLGHLYNPENLLYVWKYLVMSTKVQHLMVLQLSVDLLLFCLQVWVPMVVILDILKMVLYLDFMCHR